MAATMPGAASMVGIRAPTLGQTPLLALARLAISPRARGSGPAFDKVRRTQNIACAWFAHSVQHYQREGLDRWLARADVVDTVQDMRGFCCMWDEASQRAQANLDLGNRSLKFAACKAQLIVSVLLTLGTVSNIVVRGVEEKWEWQPWIMAPLIVPNTNADTLLESL